MVRFVEVILEVYAGKERASRPWWSGLGKSKSFNFHLHPPGIKQPKLTCFAVHIQTTNTFSTRPPCLELTSRRLSKLYNQFSELLAILHVLEQSIKGRNIA